MRTRIGAKSAAALLLLAVACGGNGGPSGDRRVSAEPPRCTVGFITPSGFRQTENSEETYSNRVGVRMGFADPAGREIHVFAGIPGEFGEGLPDHGEVTVTEGGPARLLGDGSVWVLVWDTSGACAAHAVLGNGFKRGEFLRVVKEAGVVPT